MRNNSRDEPLVLNALDLGELVHQVLDRALRLLEARDGLSKATEEQIAAAVEAGAGEAARRWESERAVPPPVIWRHTLTMARELSRRGLAARDATLGEARAYGEVAFGGAEPKSNTAAPWDPEAAVEVPDTGFRIAGYIDRLDLSANGDRALVRDYKTGRTPTRSTTVDGGKELQRCLYAFAVHAMLGDDIAIDSSLFYLRDEANLRLEAPAATLLETAGHLRAARDNLASGAALLGPDTGGPYDDLAFALPSNALAIWCERKRNAATQRLGEAARIWEAP